MSLTVFLAVIGAAMLHATWNALLKGGADKTLGMVGVSLGHVPLALIALLFVPAPTPDSYPYIFAGILLHLGYQVFLLNSYRIGDLTQVYPIARGSAPLIVALVSVAILGVQFDSLEVLAILIIATGIISVGLVRQGDGGRNGKAAVLALITGCFIAGYSLVDGLGARVAETALGYYSWVAIGNALLMVVYTRFAAPGTLRALAGPAGRKQFVIGGGASFAAYAIVTWAFTQAPIALVTALRETSIVFALLIGAVILKERIDRPKLLATAAIVVGAILLRVAK
jgi:drug/metabolite transporter (DMT)-like permease